MTFWIAGGAMTALVTIAVLAPVFRKRSRMVFTGRAQAVYADQLAELSRDETAELISGREAEAARVEIKRRLLKVAREGGAETTTQAPRGRWALVVGALLIPALGLGVYGTLGHWRLPSIPFAERADERAQAHKFQIIVNKLRTRLVEDSDVKVDGWVMLAQTYLQMNTPAEAVWAMETLIDRGGADGRPEVYGLYAEALIQSDDGIVSPKAEATLDKVLAARPDDIAAIYYKAMALEQSGEIKQAFVMLRDRIAKEPAFQPWMKLVAAHANALAKRAGADPITLPQAQAGPSAADLSAASQMSDKEREAFIRSMVARLAARLAEQPDDLEGWLKLANAYRVLGETEKSREVLKRARELVASLPADDPRRAAVTEALRAVE